MIPRLKRTGLLPAVLVAVVATATAFLIPSCASVNPRGHASVNAELLSRGDTLLDSSSERRLEDFLQLPDRSHLVALEMTSDSEVLLAYAPQSQLDRESARVRGISALYRLDPDTGTLVELDHREVGDDVAPHSSPRYREFRDRTPEEQTWFEEAIRINPEEWERRYTFLLDGPEGTPPLPVRLRAYYGRGPHYLDVSFLDPGSGQRRRWRLRLVTIDLERGVTPRLMRHLSAMRWDGERYVTFLDSIFDLQEDQRHRLVEDVPSSYVDLVTVDESWEHAVVFYGGTRIAREVAVSPLLLPGGAATSGRDRALLPSGSE